MKRDSNVTDTTKITNNDITNLFNFESPDYCFDIKYSEYARYCSL